MLGRGASIGFISSAAGLGWEANLKELQELLATPDFDGAVAWVKKHGKANYMAMKQAVCAYVACSGILGSFPNATMIAKVLMGRS
jgi:hypothetical protein